jgi:hypothetical protein
MKRKPERRLASRMKRKGRQGKKRALAQKPGMIPDIRAWRNVKGGSSFSEGYHGTGVRVKRPETEPEKRKRLRSLEE